MKPIAPENVVHMLAHELRKLGFRLHHRSDTGSRYLVYPNSPFKLRLSDHQWGNNSRMRAYDVACNFVAPPLPASDLPDTAMRLAMRFIIRARQRLGVVRAPV